MIDALSCLCSGDNTTFHKKLQQKNQILKELERNLDLLKVTIEFSYFGFTDAYSYDLQRDTVCSNDALIHKGIDFWMRPVNTIADIWNLISIGCKFPSVLKIRITNKTTHRQSSLFLFDLLQPAFIPVNMEAKNKDHIYSSFTRFRALVDYVTEQVQASAVVTDYYVLTHLVAKFICGQGYLLIFAHLNQCLRFNREECFMTLDLLEKIKKIKTTSLANNSFSDQKTSHHKPKDYKAKYEQVKQVIAQQQDMIQQLNSENEKYHGVLNANKKIYEDAMGKRIVRSP
ncbi:uncharacterized protein B0P05DRAFT_527750 [Gilbertella persicaria]|uniref:uncharacterized protein n=1 Tax=Gilbertella persicaria TaxID=101096 RepID=UPI00221F4B7F|nr:uncharacterized protein B0P05DRAFT_527750 [Gilbertella persicaria]KAI8091481.1 hypothetical protein B0P05DRAFT_527750 [Gilbertella persicaria]